MTPLPDNYWDKIPQWDARDPAKSFVILSDPLNGRIPVTRLETWRSFTDLLDQPFFNPKGKQLVYRGHRRYDWSLSPTLGRLTQNGIVTRRLANEQLALFRRAIRGRIKDHALLDDEESQNDELWSIGQHHGLKTPLLDWTYSPYVALFFAFCKEDKEDEQDNPYRSIYVLNKSFVADDEVCPDIRVFEPRKDDHGRLVNQAGLFTFSPYESTIEDKLSEVLSDEDFPDDALRRADEAKQAEILARYVCKIYIKNEDQSGCMRHLRRMNVHHASLFPDLLGASDYCNVMTAEIERERSIAEKAAQSVAVEVRDGAESADSAPAPENQIETVTPVLVLLMSHIPTQSVEFGRLQFIAVQLASMLAQGKVEDWQRRPDQQAAMKAKTRIILRKLGYPADAREQVVDQILQVGEPAVENPAS